MTKFNSGKASILVLTSALFVASFLLGKSLTSVRAVTTNCVQGCPTVAWTYSYCPEGTSEVDGGPHDGQCKHKVDNNWVYEDKVEGDTFSVTYEKSSDPNHCHRPSTDELKDTYKMTDDEANAFTDQNPQNKDTVLVAPVGYYLSNGACYPKTHVCTDGSATNFDDNFNTTTEISDNSVCKYSEVVFGCMDKSATNYNSEATSQGDIVCTYSSPTPLNCTGDQHPDAAGKNCVNFSGSGPAPRNDEGNGTGGQVLGASTTQGQVLGASTMAGTGSFEENLYIAMMGLGAVVTVFGVKNFKRA